MEESREHSNLLDRKFLDNNSAFFFKTLRPRLSHYAVRADDACIQTQIDVFGKEHVGIMPGSLAPSGNFAATVYSESLPDRLPILAYLNEILSFYEGTMDPSSLSLLALSHDCGQLADRLQLLRRLWRKLYGTCFSLILSLATQG